VLSSPPQPGRAGGASPGRPRGAGKASPDGMLDGIAAQLRQLALLQGKGSRLASQLAVQA